MRPPYILRVEEEKKELDIKIEALAYWISNSEHFNQLDPSEKQDQRDQLAFMRGYTKCLASRLERFGQQHATPRLQK